MRTLTKSGIRELTAKYRSVLKKCAILNAMVLMLGAGTAMAEDMTWSKLKNDIDNAEPKATIEIPKSITRDVASPDGDITISKELSIIGSETGTTYLDGGHTDKVDGYKGLKVDKDANLTLKNITMQNFNNTTPGGAILNYGNASITGNFTSNRSNSHGGAIYNTNGNIESIIGDFESNRSNSYGGAIYNEGNDANNGVITDITGNFTSNTGNVGGAIFNKGRIKNVTGNFTQNSANMYGGALANMSGAEVNFVANKNITFDGNYVTTGNGGAIYNAVQGTTMGTVGLYAAANHSITFLGDKTTQELPNNAKDVDGIYNTGNLNINGSYDSKTYTGTVNLYNVDGTGTTNIYGGTVHFGGDYTQGATNIHGGTLNFANNKINTANLGTLNLVGNANLILDADLAAEGKMDQLKVTSVSGDGNIVISDIKLLSDATKDEVSLSLFAEGTPSSVYDKVSGKLNGLKYSPTYLYDAKYNTENGIVTFTRTEQVHPYLYAPSTMAQTTANITGQIAGLAMDKLDAAVTDSEKGLAGGDMPKANNAWVKVMGFDDDVDFKGFNNSIDSKAYTLAAGFNTDKVKFDNFDAAFGVYGGYIGGHQKYTGSKIEQNGGYVGLSSELTKGNAFLLSTINGGFINNEAENMYGTDKFDTRWFGVGMKGGYNYTLKNSVVFQPNIYAGYTFVNTEDYTSKSGVRINNDNLNFFEIDPGFKLMTQIDKNWLGFIQGKYAIVMDNGGETTVNEIVLPNISAKNYFEYGFGMNKFLTDVWSLHGEINRRDGGRHGWNGSLEFKYHF